MNPEFKIGDEVFLEKGFPVWTDLPEKYVYANRPFSEKLTKARVSLGVLYTTDEIAKRDIKEEANHIANKIWRYFSEYYYEVDFKVCKEFVEQNIDVNKKLECTEFILSEGTFIISQAIYHPASTGHDYIPESYSYKAVRKDGTDEIEFSNWEYYFEKWHFANKQQPNDKRNEEDNSDSPGNTGENI